MQLKLKQLREQKRISQRKLAEMLGKSFGTIQSWERGDSFPNAEMVWRLCEVFGTDPNDFLGWWEDHPREDGGSPGLTAEEAEVLGCYREAAPQWRTNIAMTARAAAGESKKAAPPAVPSEPVERSA